MATKHEKKKAIKGHTAVSQGVDIFKIGDILALKDFVFSCFSDN